MYRVILTAFCCAWWSASLSCAGNWGHWRGPNGNSVAPDAHPPTTWSPTENVQWKVEIPGSGTGSPVVWGDQVFVVTAVPSEDSKQLAEKPRTNLFQSTVGPLPELKFQLLCFDRSTGASRWRQTAVVATPHQGTHVSHGFASASPCTDGEHVYAHFGSRGIYCYTMDGELVWKRDDLGKMKIQFGFGEGSSPTIAADKIIVPWDHQGDSYLLALNKLTGEQVWKTPRDEPSCWGTPLVVQHGSDKQVVMQGQSFARSCDLETGRELWKCPGQTFRPIASPVAEEGLVIVGSGFAGGFMGAFRLDGMGDIEGTESVIWTLDRNAPDVGSPALSDGRLYFYKGQSGILSCLNAKTGQPYYSAKRIAGLRDTYASPVVAGGHVYLTDRGGTIVVIEDSEVLNIVASNTLDEPIDATLAAAGNQLFIRGAKHLFCIGE